MERALFNESMEYNLSRLYLFFQKHFNNAEMIKTTHFDIDVVYLFVTSAAVIYFLHKMTFDTFIDNIFIYKRL